MPIRLRVRNRDGVAGAFKIFLDDELMGAGFTAEQAAAYVRDMCGSSRVVPVGRASVSFSVPPEVASALAQLGTVSLEQTEEPTGE